MAHVIAVGWDKKIHIWADQKEEEVVCNKILPRNEQRGHTDDIMSVAYNYQLNLIYTGGHDGSLIAWNFETGYIKNYLHELDPSCTLKNGGDYILQQKSVDCLLILYKKEILVSVSADQTIRFWNFDITKGRQPVFTLHGDHERLDSLSAIATTMDNNFLVTGDTAGCLKMWDLTNFRYSIDHTSENIIEKWFIQAHRRVINCIQVVEIEKQADGEKFIVSSSNDHNVHLTRFSDGVHIGQFGQDSMWNIHDLSAFNNRPPRYTRSWM